MTQALILVPGIEGSRLSLNGTEIWPPTFWEAILGYHRIAELRNPAAYATAVVDKVAFVAIYKPIIDDLDRIAASLGAARSNFFYDWRRDIVSVATAALAKQIEAMV